MSTTQELNKILKKYLYISPKYSRLTEETTNGASNKEEKLLWEEDQSDLL